LLFWRGILVYFGVEIGVIRGKGENNAKFLLNKELNELQWTKYVMWVKVGKEDLKRF